MNHTLKLIGCFLFFQATAFAQTFNFAPVGATWYYSEEAFAPPPFGSFPHVVEVESQEFYQGKLCSKLVGIGSETMPNPLYVYSQNDSVFFYSLLSNRFELLYDFGANAGDSWVIGGLNKPGEIDSLPVHVDSISQIIVSGVTLKVLHLSCPFPVYDWGCEIIAGIGNPYFITPDYGLYEGGPQGLRCYSDPNNDLHFVPYPCDTTLIISGTENIAQGAGVSVFPNPVQEYVNVLLEINTNTSVFQLYDSYGKLVKQKTLQIGMNTIYLQNGAVGIYFWKVESDKKIIRTGHLINLQTW